MDTPNIAAIIDALVEVNPLHGDYISRAINRDRLLHGVQGYEAASRFSSLDILKRKLDEILREGTNYLQPSVVVKAFLGGVSAAVILRTTSFTLEQIKELRQDYMARYTEPEPALPL